MEELNIKREISKKNPFKVPEGYFEQLKKDVLAALPEREESKVVPIAVRYPLFRPLIGVAASLCIAIFGISLYLHNEEKASIKEAQNGGQTTSEMLFASDDAYDYIMLDNEDIYLYLCEEDGD